MKRRGAISDFDLGGTIAFRAIGLVLGLGASLLIVGTMTRKFGATEYAAFALLASFINLLPFADLGLGASIVNAVADGRSQRYTREAVTLHVSRARDVLIVVALAISGVSLSLLFWGAWPLLLGSTSGVQGISVAATVTMILVGASVPFGIGNRLLQGAGRMRRVVQIALLGPVLQAIGCGALALVDAPAVAFAYLPGVGYTAVALAAFIFAVRSKVVALLPPLVALLRWRSDTIRLADTAVPFLIISVALAFGFQSHRLILAQIGTADDLASYSLVAQFAGPVLALLTVAAQNLWSKYRIELGNGGLTTRRFASNVSVFAVVGVVAAIALFASVQVVGGPLTDGVVVPSVGVSLGAAAYVVIVAIHQPSAMLLNSPRGLWLQAVLVSFASFIAVVAMIFTVPRFGAAAPYAVFSAAMLFIQVIPTLVVSVRTIARRNREDH